MKDLCYTEKLEDKEESLRTIFIPSILDDVNIVTLLLKHKELLNKVVAKTSSEEAQDFMDKLKALYPSYKKNEEMMELFSNFKIEILDQKNDK